MNFVLSGENLIVWVEVVVSSRVSRVRREEVGVARDKGHSIVSPANRSGAPKNLHRAESGPHGLSAWQTRGPNLLGVNNGTEFKRCISRASLLPWFIVHFDCH